MGKKLLGQGLIKYVSGVILVGLMLFLPAGTLHFPNGWLFMGLLFLPMLGAGFVMYFKNPDLLRRRLNAREKEGEQKLVLAGSVLMFLAAFVLAGLNFRFQWTVMPRWLVALGAAVFLLSYALYAEVLRENAYLSRTVEVQENQKVIDTGLYGIVRHPMYAVTVWLFLSMALVLGSLPSLIVMLIYPALLIRRILNEEKVLEEGLPGYREYEKKVKWRLIPFIW